MDFWSAECAALGAAGEGEALRDCVVHHQPMPMINSKSNAIPTVANLRPLGRDLASDFVTTALRRFQCTVELNQESVTDSFDLGPVEARKNFAEQLTVFL